jgi:non-heme chloroperoxidase
MPYITVRNRASGQVDLYYEDLGAGRPVVLIHGWPLSSAAWERQVPVLLDAGYRVVFYDRRGFGGSSRPASGYDYDTLAADLDELMTGLDIREAALCGFSMGTGECARYLSRYGSDRVRAVAFLASIPPFLLKTPDNPGGVDRAVFDGMRAAIARDRYAFASSFLRDYYNVGLLGGDRASDDVVRASWNLAALASARALSDCVPAWLTDFRADLPHVDVPALVVHGDDDWVLPIAATGLRLHQSLAGSRWVVIEGGSHGLLWTHADEVNRALLAFLEAHMRGAVR